MMGDKKPFDNKVLSERLDINFALQAAGLGVWEIDPKTNQVQWDERCWALVGLDKNDHMPFEQAIQYIHPEDLTRVLDAIQWAMKAESDGVFDQTYRTLGADSGKLRWVRFWGQGYFTPAGEVYRFSGVAQEVTQLVVSQQKMEESEAQLHSIVQQTPAPTLVLRGDDYRIAQINQPMVAFMGRGGNVIGRPYLSVMPELAGQFAWRQVQRAYQEGVDFDQSEVLIPHARNGVLQDIYYNVSYRPLWEQEQIKGVILVAIDVTEQRKARKDLGESKAVLEAIIDLAELGSYSIDPTTNQITKSPRVAHWYGLPQVTDVATSMAAIAKNDQDRISRVLAEALDPGSDGFYQVEYTVIHAQTGYRRILRTNGQVIWNEDGLPVRIDGTVMDITNQQALQLALEQQVEQRTKELATAINELAVSNHVLEANNEEYAAINEELEEANGLLIRSNDNLQKFAYIASHDLQEPLRKIQQFGDLLKTRFADSVSGGELIYLERMQVAASRMSTLIKDLLGFSRISTQRNSAEPVPLNRVISSVLSVLDMTLEEAKAQVQVDDLPTVLGDDSQLQQLFQNLLSNALKFHRTDQAGVPVAPRIHISSQAVAAEQLPPAIKPTQRARLYYRIDVRDNGIGFEEKFLDRIFQVFQRLHGRNEFAGTGIGLAICEKVVLNHGGVITASSQLGVGSTFSIYLPA